MSRKSPVGNPWFLLLTGIVIAAFLILLFAPRDVWLRGSFVPWSNQGDERPSYPRNPRTQVKENKDYRLQIWVELPPGSERATAYRTWLEDRLQQFAVDWPNVMVEKRYFLNPTAAKEAMTLALAAGTPPDLYLPSRTVSSIPRDFIGWDLALPVAPYMTEEIASEYHPAALALAGEEPLAWPWAIVAESWLVHGALADLPSTEGSEAVKKTLAAWQQGQRSMPLGVVPTGLRAVDGLTLVAAGQARRPINFLGDLATSGLVRMRSGLLDDWVEKRVGALAGASPKLQEQLVRRLSGKEQAAWVPLPNLNDKEETSPLVAEWYGLFIYRQEAYAGDDHSRAAVELARFVTREMPPWLPQTPMVVGAHRPVSDEDSGSSDPVRSAMGTVPPTWLVDGLAQPERWRTLPSRTDQEQERIGELIAELLKGKAGDQAQKLVKELERNNVP